MDYKGTVIEESLEDRSILDDIKILGTKVEQVTEKHKTPWLKQWTLHTIEIPEAEAAGVAEHLSQNINTQHATSWYIDYKNDRWHYVIFRDKVFVVDRSKPEQYEAVTRYGVSVGIPDYQLDFSPDIA